MGSFSIIQAAIVLHDDAGFRNGKEDFLVQALVPKPAMETFNKSILPGTARLNIQRLDVGELTPILNDMGDKFDTVHLKSPKIRQLHRKWLFSLKRQVAFCPRFPADIRIRRR